MTYIVGPTRRALSLLAFALTVGACQTDDTLIPTDPGASPAAEEPSLSVSQVGGMTASSMYQGIPFGPADFWATYNTLRSGPGPFTGSTNFTSAGGIIKQIESARAIGHRLVLNMTGGNHDRYKTDGKFDLTKWKKVQDTYNSTAIKAAVAAGVTDGTVLLNSIMDEPSIKSWGGVVTKSMLDDMGSYVKAMFPTLPVGVAVRHDWRTTEQFRVLDAYIVGYAHRKGTVSTFREQVMAQAAKEKMAVAFALNILDGGIVDYKNRTCPEPQTGGYGTYSPACRMTSSQVRDWGRFLGPTGCALFMWRYETDVMNDPAYQQAFKDVAPALANAPARACRRGGDSPPLLPPPPPEPSNTPPTADFTPPTCTPGEACEFRDGSSDDDGSIASRVWDFAGSATSTVANPAHTFAASGTYSVTLTVTDDAGVSTSLTKSVTVAPKTEPVSNLALGLTSFMRDGRQFVVLTWSGLAGTSVDLYRDGTRLETTPNDKKQNSVIPLRGKASYAYKLCERGSSRCTASVTFTLPAIVLNVKAWMKEPSLQAMTLQWAGTNSTSMSVYRNGVLIKTGARDGQYTNTRRFKGPATYTYKVCEAATSKCSNTATATFR